MIDAGPRNHLYLLGQQVKIRSSPRNQKSTRQLTELAGFCVWPSVFKYIAGTARCGVLSEGRPGPLQRIVCQSAFVVTMYLAGFRGGRANLGRSTCLFLAGNDLQGIETEFAMDASKAAFVVATAILHEGVVSDFYKFAKGP